MKSILGREGEAVAVVFFPVTVIRTRVGIAGDLSCHHGSCKPLCGNTDLAEVNWSGGLKGAGRVLCAGGNCTESQDESHGCQDQCLHVLGNKC